MSKESPFIVYVHDTKTGKVAEVGVFDELPLILAEDGSGFISTKMYAPISPSVN